MSAPGVRIVLMATLTLLITACSSGAVATTAPATATNMPAAPTVRPTPTLRPTEAPRPTPTLRPAPTAAQPAATATPAPVDVRSIGLGRTRADWERSNGKPQKSDGIGATYADGIYYVVFDNDRVAHLERIWGDANAKTVDFVLGATKSMIPADAKEVRAIKSAGGSPGILYHSGVLASVFPAASFINGDPGDFVLLFRTNSAGSVTSAVMGLGNNP